jgi:hypothetical protein
MTDIDPQPHNDTHHVRNRGLGHAASPFGGHCRRGLRTEFVDVPGAGHMLMLDRPDVVNDRLDALLERARRELAPRPPTPAAQAVPASAPLPLAA